MPPLKAHSYLLSHIGGCFSMSLMLIVCNSAGAEPVKVTESNSATYYVDLNTIKKKGDLRRAWVINDKVVRDSSGALSIRVLDESDCQEERHRILSYSYHADHMARGTILRSGDVQTEWEHIPPGSTGAKILQVVCSR